jgi:hypothetical protein
VASDQKFMLKASTFQFARSCLEMSKWSVESLQCMCVFYKNCIFSGVLDQRRHSCTESASLAITVRINNTRK